MILTFYESEYIIGLSDLTKLVICILKIIFYIKYVYSYSKARFYGEEKKIVKNNLIIV